jgi:hypothetical protein
MGMAGWVRAGSWSAGGVERGCSSSFSSSSSSSTRRDEDEDEDEEKEED